MTVPQPPTGPYADSPIAQLLVSHPAWPAHAQLGAGWSVPPIDTLREIAIAADQQEVLEALGITLRKPPGQGNRLLLDAATPPQQLRLDLSHAQNCTIILARDGVVRGDVMMTGRRHVLAAAGTDVPAGNTTHCTHRGEDSLILLGRGATSNGAKLLVDGRGRAILVGDDAMFSYGITIRTTDSHALIDIASREQLNPPASVVIGPHVWIGQEALVNKGTTVGAASIIAARAVVTRDIPARTLAGGVPARTIRKGITWSRKAMAAQEEIEATLARWGGMD